MSVLTALYETYLNCEEEGLVDRIGSNNKSAILLPIYHTNKKIGNNDVIEVTIDESGNFVRAKYLDNEIDYPYIIFPVTEDSLSRTSKPVAHPLCDELSYVTSDFSDSKYEIYLETVQSWFNYNQRHKIDNVLKPIFNYVQKNTLIRDLVVSLYKTDDFVIKDKSVEIVIEGKKVSIKEKDFVVFRIETVSGKDIKTSFDTGLHQNYIEFVESLLDEKEKHICDISGESLYCTDKHRGLFGNAKLISVSNNKETYFGRFQSGQDIINIGYSTSQKIHNMLKYLLENQSNSIRIDGTTAIVTWPSRNLDNFSLELNSEQTFVEEVGLASLNIGNINDEQDFIKEETSKRILEIISGGLGVENNDNNLEEDFYVLIVDKVSNGRVSIKYYRQLFMSDLVERVKIWYETTYWQYGFGQYQTIKSPSLFQIVNRVFGEENKEKKYIELKKEKVKKKNIEKLFPSIIDNKRISIDIVNRMLDNVSNRQKYSVTWNTLVSTACSIFKRYKSDYKNERVITDVNKMNTRDYLYGRLLAVYEAIELSGSTTQEGKQKVTNSEKYWSAFTRSPEKTHLLLHNKIQPYLTRLKKKPGLNIYYQEMLKDIINKINTIEISPDQKNTRLNEEFIFGYYAQKEEIYRKREHKEEDLINDNIN